MRADRPDVTARPPNANHGSLPSGADKVEIAGRQLAEQHASPGRPGPDVHLLSRPAELEDRLDETYRQYARATDPRTAFSTAAEWLLDNYHVAAEAVRR